MNIYSLYQNIKVDLNNNLFQTKNYMSSKVPIVKEINWFSIIPHLLVIGIIIFTWNLYYPNYSTLLGCLTYIIISYTLRTQIPKPHTKGMKLVKSGDFEKAIPYFEKSYDFFQDNIWVDKYRFLTILSSSKMSYQEMSLVNIAFCYSQIGNGEKSKEFYLRTLKEFPENSIAITSLRMLNSVQNN